MKTDIEQHSSEGQAGMNAVSPQDDFHRTRKRVFLHYSSPYRRLRNPKGNPETPPWHVSGTSVINNCLHCCTVFLRRRQSIVFSFVACSGIKPPCPAIWHAWYPGLRVICFSPCIMDNWINSVCKVVFIADNASLGWTMVGECMEKWSTITGS
jgi:hypothetical protein